MNVQQVSMKISEKGQVVIPALIRKKFGWRPGMHVLVSSIRSSELVFKKKPEEDVIEELAGSMKGKIPTTKRYLEMKKHDKDREE